MTCVPTPGREILPVCLGTVGGGIIERLRRVKGPVGPNKLFYQPVPPHPNFPASFPLFGEGSQLGGGLVSLKKMYCS